ncbi:MAG: DUF4339 domain-containing protein [Acidobacteria bacterium]|nr:DUF4339 domain-containing protein [Acidobacteriota bacterium]
MPYHVTREGQTYGPYSLEDLQRYVASGNVLLTDLAKADDAAEWVPVAQILGVTTPPATPPAAPGYVPAPVNPYLNPGASTYPDPPNLHWALVLVIAICTCGVFAIIWDFVQVLWVRRIEPQTRAFTYFLFYVVLSFINGGLSAGASAAVMSGHTPHRHPASFVIALGVFVLVILYRFSMKNSIEQFYNTVEPLGLRLGPVMTFFFGGLYFQYHFNRINQIKQAARYRGI